MSREYRQQTIDKYIRESEVILDEMPMYVRSYIKNINNSVEPNTKLSYLRDIKTYLTYIMDADADKHYSSVSDVKLEDLIRLGVDIIDDFQNALGQYQKNGTYYKTANVTIRRKMSSISGLYKYLYTHDYIPNNPIDKIRSVKVSKKNIIRLEADEKEKLKDMVLIGNPNASNKKKKFHDKLGTRDYALISLLLGTGIRVSECVGLDIPDINTKTHKITVIRKGGKEDTVFMSDDLSEIMDEYIEYRNGIEAEEGHEKALFLSYQNKRLSVRSVEKLVKKYTLDAGITKTITPHKLRSTFGTDLYEATTDLYVTKAALGHSSIKSTEMYAELTAERKESVRNKVK